MKLTKFDIGAEIIAILTKGMYQDPRDALREYIQNAIDAKAKNVSLRIRQNNVTIMDDGYGMNYQTMRNALRVGVSDKKPGEDVGFMGIGIYSAYHLCDTLTIYSKTGVESPFKLFMDFKQMKSALEKQKELRIKNELSGDQLIDLQTLLEKYIDLTDKDGLPLSEFPLQGTRVELHGIESNFYKELLDFDFVADYLRDVIPLHFDSTKFSWAGEIEKKMQDICNKHSVRLDLVNLNLQVNNKKEDLYKPYENSQFHENKPIKPKFQEIKNSETFIGVAWGCLNPTRNKIQDRKLRGFLVRKQGFAIGRRENIVKYFNSHTYFDRYIGEIIVVNPGLLPNASRNDFEFSSLRIIFNELLTDIASNYNKDAQDYQDTSKAIETLERIEKDVKNINLKFNRFEEDTNQLIDFIVKIDGLSREVDSIINRKVLKKILDKEKEAKKIHLIIEELKKDLRSRIDFVREQKKANQSKNNDKHKSENNKIKISKELSTVNIHEQKKEYNNLIELLEDLDLEMDNKYREMFSLLDEMFIERVATNKSHYSNLLLDLKQGLISILDSE